MKKFVLNIIGPGCSGKSTLSTTIGERYPGTYLISYDKLKWQLFGYNRVHDKEIMKQLAFGVYEVVCKLGIPIIYQPFFIDEADYECSRAMAVKFGYEVFTVAVTAPRDILLTRFRARVKSAQESRSKISVTDEEVFLENMAKPRFLPPETPVFDTSVMTAEQIADEVDKLFLK